MVLEVLHVYHCSACNQVESVNKTGGSWKHHQKMVPLPEKTRASSGNVDFDLDRFGSAILAICNRGQEDEMFYLKRDESVQNSARDHHLYLCPRRPPAFKKLDPFEPSTAGEEHSFISSARKANESLNGFPLKSNL